MGSECAGSDTRGFPAHTDDVTVLLGNRRSLTDATCTSGSDVTAQDLTTDTHRAVTAAAPGARADWWCMRVSQKYFPGNMYESSSPEPLSSYSSAAECTPTNVSVSEEDLRNELSLLGYPSVPRKRFLQFKKDLEYLMRSQRPSDLSPRSSGGRAEAEKENSPVSPAWPTTSSASDQAPGRRGGPDSYSTHTVCVGGPSLGKHRAPALTRKVLRRKSDGQVEVCDESLLSSQSQTGDEDTTVSSGITQPESVGEQLTDCAKSFIRLPPYSLLDQYRHRSDPVGRYQGYKQSWDALHGAQERSIKELRWEVRERMMSAPPLSLPRLLPTPNPYVIPTEKKRYGLRWAIRQDLVNGNIPRGSYS